MVNCLEGNEAWNIWTQMFLFFCYRFQIPYPRFIQFHCDWSIFVDAVLSCVQWGSQFGWIVFAISVGFILELKVN